ncbi:hypothetical protein A5642_09960 [Mycolicibacterium mucogenicum]|jgi:hypothetical protein|uniref:Lipoprotein LpqJ n=1 Tax=Mycolicibacterium mucogenicum TaxID=56689 RepID=A0A1A0N2L6_MYCMU|nr:hypothetical protein [Mycolicibacterium mucogenicum]OBA91551.1 hypothetical protein A5642_09960 [Mycolicibacterium mucogenicum]
MNHTRLTMSATAALAAVLLAGCDSTTPGSPKSGLPSGETSAASTPTPSEKVVRPVPVSPIPVPSAVPPTAQALAPQNGYVFIATKSGQTRCQLNATAVDCESNFANAPQINGESANGVRVTTDGKLSWVVGNLGAIPTVTLDYQTYSAVGWTILAGAEGTHFTNAGTGHGMFVSTAGVKAF